MSEVLVKDKDIVVPGEILAQGMDNFPGNGSYRDGEKIYSLRVGLVHTDGRTMKVIPMSGVYMPKVGDTVICKVIDIMANAWRVETNSPYSAVLFIADATTDYINKGEDLSQYYNLGDYIVCKITAVTSQKLVNITMREQGLRKLSGGRIFKVNTNKVPRIIGKKGSMVSMIKQATGCRIIIGQNGICWVQGEIDSELLAIEVVKKIEDESHQSGLTNKIKEFLEQKTGNKIGEVDEK